MVGSVAFWAESAPLISASGLDGAGLGQLPVAQGRAFGELGYHSQDDLSIATVDLGVGFMPTESLELGLLVPWTQISGDDDSESELGNLSVHVALVETSAEFRYSLGFRLTPPTASDSFESMLINVMGALPSSYQHLGSRFPGALTLSTPIHLEGGQSFVGLVDAEALLLTPTSDELDGDSEVYATVAPGLGGWVSPNVALGFRFPTFLLLTEDAGDQAQLSVEPFARFILGTHGFLGLRFNMPLDEPLSDADMWGLMLGGGGAF